MEWWIDAVGILVPGVVYSGQAGIGKQTPPGSVAMHILPEGDPPLLKDQKLSCFTWKRVFHGIFFAKSLTSTYVQASHPSHRFSPEKDKQVLGQICPLQFLVLKMLKYPDKKNIFIGFAT